MYLYFLRLNLLNGLLLVLINSFNSVTGKIPNADGINALVAYLFTCIFFVFGALSGYAGRYNKGSKNSPNSDNSGILFTRNRRARKIGDSTLISSLPATPSPGLNISVIGLLIAPVMNTADQSPRPSLTPELSKENQLSLTPAGSTHNLTPPSPAKPKPKSKTPWQTRHEFAHVDHVFMIVFPTMFALFNIIYWTICLYFQDSIVTAKK